MRERLGTADAWYVYGVDGPLWGATSGKENCKHAARIPGRIEANARAWGRRLVSRNTAFERVPGLRVVRY